MKALVAVLERIATALEQLTPALTQVYREMRQADRRSSGYEIRRKEASVNPGDTE